MASKKQKNSGTTIALNKKAKFDYELHERFEAGLALTGWEVKSLRADKGQITDAFVQFKNGEAWLHGARLTPLASASTHLSPSRCAPANCCSTAANSRACRTP